MACTGVTTPFYSPEATPFAAHEEGSGVDVLMQLGTKEFIHYVHCVNPTLRLVASKKLTRDPRLSPTGPKCLCNSQLPNGCGCPPFILNSKILPQGGRPGYKAMHGSLTKRSKSTIHFFVSLFACFFVCFFQCSSSYT